jgi:hypothetical protein
MGGGAAEQSTAPHLSGGDSICLEATVFDFLSHIVVV